MSDFSRGSVERAARDSLAERIEQNGAARDPYAVATEQVRRLSTTPQGRQAILKMAMTKVSQGTSAFGGDDPEGDLRRTRRAIQQYRVEPRPRNSLFSRMAGRGFSRAGGRM